MPQRLGDLVQSFGYGASAGMTEPARAMLGAALAKDPGLYQVLLDSAIQEREQRRKESPVATTIAELGGALMAGGAVRNIPQNIAHGAMAGYNEAGNVRDAITGAALTGAASGLARALPTKQAPVPTMVAEAPKRVLPEAEKLKEIPQIPLDKLPPDVRQRLEDMGFKAATIVQEYQKFLDNPKLTDATYNTVRRLVGVEINKYKTAVDKAKMEFSDILQTPQAPVMIAKQYEPIRQTAIDFTNVTPLQQFAIQAAARYKAGAQDQPEIPQPQPFNIPKRYIQQ